MDLGARYPLPETETRVRRLTCLFGAMVGARWSTTSDSGQLATKTVRRNVVSYIPNIYLHTSMYISGMNTGTNLETGTSAEARCLRPQAETTFLNSGPNFLNSQTGIPPKTGRFPCLHRLLSHILGSGHLVTKFTVSDMDDEA